MGKMGVKARGEIAGLLYGGLGLIAAFALVFVASVPAAAGENHDQVPSWKAARCVFETGFYVAEIPSSLMDEGDTGCNQCAVKSRPFADLLRRSKTSENLIATSNQSAPVPTLTRLAPKRSPPAAPLFV
jgi:hypothetical protein